MGVRTGPGTTQAAVAEPVFLVDPATGLPYIPAGSTGGTTTKATAAAPALAEGSTTNQLSVTLDGSLRVSGAGGGQQYAEDAAHASGDLGTMALSVRKDTAAALAGADGDYQPLVTDASGRLHVNDVAVLTAMGVVGAPGAGTLLKLITDLLAQAQSTTPTGVFAAGREYEFVAASSADQPLGAAGAVNDTLDSLIIVPLTTSPGEVKIKDGTAGTYRTIFLGGATSVGDLKPFEIGLSLKALAAGGWIINTGANVQVFAAGDFT